MHPAGGADTVGSTTDCARLRHRCAVDRAASRLGARLSAKSHLSHTGDGFGARNRWVGGDLRQLHDSDADRLVERLAEDYGSDLVRFIARRVRSAVDAQDLAQEAYVRLLRLERKDLIRDPRSYLYRIASNILYEFELKQRADAAGLMRWSDERLTEAKPGSTEGDLETLSLRGKLEATMDELSPKCRAVVILHRRDGMTYEEIGSEIGISISMVKKYLAKGLRHCRERLKETR